MEIIALFIAIATVGAFYWMITDEESNKIKIN
jgi:hypothetical protein